MLGVAVLDGAAALAAWPFSGVPKTAPMASDATTIARTEARRLLFTPRMCVNRTSFGSRLPRSHPVWRCGIGRSPHRHGMKAAVSPSAGPVGVDGSPRIEAMVRRRIGRNGLSARATGAQGKATVESWREAGSLMRFAPIRGDGFSPHSLSQRSPAALAQRPTHRRPRQRQRRRLHRLQHRRNG